MSAQGGNGFADSGNGCGGSVDGFEGRPSGPHTASDGQAGGGVHQPPPVGTWTITDLFVIPAGQTREEALTAAIARGTAVPRNEAARRWLQLGRRDPLPGFELEWSREGLAEQPSSPGDTDV